MTLHNYATTTNSVNKHYHDIIVNVTKSMDLCFKDLGASPVFKHLCSILDVSSWPLNDGINFFGESAVIDLGDCFDQLLRSNGCDVDVLIPEWLALKMHMIPIIKNNPKEHYINIWQRVMKSDIISNDCPNILHIIEILLCMPFSNAKLEQMFSRMARVKTDYHNRLSRSLLDACLCVSEEGVSISSFDPDPAIKQWYEIKVQWLTASPHNYPSK